MLTARPIEGTDPVQYAWTYAEDPTASLVDEVRFLVRDTDPNIPLISDLEIQYLLDTWMDKYDSTLMVAAHAAETISRSFAGLVSISADGVSVQVGDVSAKWDNVAKQLRAAHKAYTATEGTIPFESIMADFMPDQSIAPLNFGIGGQDNPYAGRQTGSNWHGYGPSWTDTGWLP